MKKLILIVLIAAACFTSFGCDNSTQTWDERMQRYALIQDIQNKQIADDWDVIWLADHNSRLTYWHPYVGW